MKKFLLLLFFCLPMLVMAQTDEKYLTGAVPVVDGKVTFSTQLQVPALSQEQMFETALNWAKNYFKTDDKFNARVLYSNKEEGMIAAAGEEYIVFSSSALSLDRTRIYYQFLITCHPGKCDLEMTRIRYLYDEARDGGEKYTAEEWITDDMALNKSKTKLAPICGKFRRKTIDLKNELFKSMQTAVGEQLIAMGIEAKPAAPAATIPAVTMTPATPVNNTTAGTPVVATPAASVNVSASTTTATPVVKSIDEQIKLSTRMTITAGNDEQFEIGKECWGGFGQLFGKEVAFCIIDAQKTMGNMLLSQSPTYTIAFYQQGQNEPCVTIKCKKLTQQSLTGEEAKNMNAHNDGTKTYNMYVGEVVK